ncbi:hypothetical protein [Dactylosporangium roseum]|uniref:hypothetical protein n=1 Tax=Dactylosporangium roseum TaxID=47989 RepID=UPI0031E1C12C
MSNSPMARGSAARAEALNQREEPREQGAVANREPGAHRGDGLETDGVDRVVEAQQQERQPDGDAAAPLAQDSQRRQGAAPYLPVC